MRIIGSVGFITGGARGLGRGFAELLLEEGGKVCLADINTDQGRETEQELKQKYGSDHVMFVRCDVTNEHNFSAALESCKNFFGGIDILVNNAGLSQQDYTLMISVNLTGVIRGCHLGLEYLSKARSGRGGLIVNIGSTAGLTPIGYGAEYAATKYGVVGYSRSLQMQLDESGEDHGVRVTCLCPSFTMTEMTVVQKEVIDSDTQVSDKGAAAGIDLMKNVGFIKVSDVARAFHELVVNDGNKGGVLAVTPKGLRYKYPHSLKPRL